MKPENKIFLDKERYHYDRIRTAGADRGLDFYTRHEMARIYGEEFAPGYTLPCDCGGEVLTMVVKLYEAYDKYLLTETK